MKALVQLSILKRVIGTPQANGKTFVNSNDKSISPRVHEEQVVLSGTAPVQFEVPIRLECSYKDAQKTIELLQAQNEMLRSRLSLLQQAINARSDCESSLERVLSEVIEIMQSLCIDSVSSKSNILSSLSFDYSKFNPAPPNNSGTTVNAPMPASDANIKGVSWKAVSARLLKLQAQWFDIKNSSKQSLRGNSSLCSLCGKSTTSDLLQFSTVYKDVIDLSIQAHSVIDTLYEDTSTQSKDSGNITGTNNASVASSSSSEFQNVTSLSLIRHNILIDYAMDSTITKLQGEIMKLTDASDKLLANCSPLIPLALCNNITNNKLSNVNTPAIVQLVEEVIFLRNIFVVCWC